MTVLLVGRGLLGRHTVTALRAAGETVREVDVRWSDPAGALVDLLGAADAAAAEDEQWSLAWTAGAGVTATPAEHFEAEVSLFRAVCRSLIRPPRAMFLASSAGGVYAGSPDLPPYSETSRASARAPYGLAKLEMEDAVRDLAAEADTRVMIGRISNLYGPGQDLAKPQGLVSQLCLTQVTARPLGVYVSLDTLRDYLYAPDAGRLAAACLTRVSEEPAGAVVTKVLCTGRASSIGDLIAISTRVFRRRPLLFQRVNPQTSVQAKDLRMRSIVWPDLDPLAETPMLVGLRATAEDVGARYRRSGLALVAR